MESRLVKKFVAKNLYFSTIVNNDYCLKNLQKKKKIQIIVLFILKLILKRTNIFSTINFIKHLSSSAEEYKLIL